ncbi:MAG: ABC transporter permease [Clostridia bacterium]|nr:ABC transporter permease [Clostridia bacterium]
MDANIAEKDLRRRSGIGTKILLNPEIGVMIPILILCVVTTSINSNFLTWKYISSILIGSVFIGAAALGESVILMAGEIDLSVGMGGCMAGMMSAIAAQEWGLGLVPCLLIGLLAGGFVGFINGLCVTKLGLSAWITTLATQFICEGLAQTVSNGIAIYVKTLNTIGFVNERPLGLSWLFFIFIGLILLLDFVIRKTKFGYKLRAVGGNKEAARMAGLNVNRIKIAAFVIASMLAAVGGIFDALNSDSAVWTLGSGREFRAIICCAIGGISMSGGNGSMYGVGLGVLLFHTLWSCLRLLKVDTNLQLLFIGLILVAAVLLDGQRKRMDQRNELLASAKK